MARAYYNENDEYAAQWLRNLIAAGHIADGDVDERSIEDVMPADLDGYTQCHFFAGIGVWSRALRQAEWRDDEPVWTGSCPCQPFSTTGKGGGFTDERHLWPAFFHLIEQRRPGVVLGEQVASTDGLNWLDLVQADLEGAGYAVGALDLCAAGIGAPHIRQRLWWVADGLGNRFGTRLEGHPGDGDRAVGRTLAAGPVAASGEPCGLADGQQSRHEGGSIGSHPSSSDLATEDGIARGLADGDQQGRVEFGAPRLHERWDGTGSADPAAGDPDGARGDDLAGCSPTHGYWRDVDWLWCRDGKWRPVEPGSSPLVVGAAARVGKLRAYGNAIVAPLAEAFIRSYLDVSRP